MPIGTGVYGSNASNALGAIGGTVSAGQLISGSAMTAIANAGIAERIRRGKINVVSVPPGFYSGIISVNNISVISALVEVDGQPTSVAQNGANQNINSPNGQVVVGYTPEVDDYGNPTGGQTPVYGPAPQPETVTYPQVAAVVNPTPFATFTGTRIRASHINSIIDQINSSRAACTCNCNYCTCNCNYCTCNCNYACTCNCNYSDEKVKTNIEYMQ